MKWNWIIAILIAVVVYWQPLPANAQTLPVEIQLERMNVLPGDEFVLTISASKLNGQSFATLTGRLMIDPNYVQILGAMHGAALPPNTQLFLTPTSEGESRLDIIAPANAKISTEGVLVNLHLKSLTRVDTPILLWDTMLDEGNPQVNVHQGSVNSNNITVNVEFTFGPFFAPVKDATVTILSYPPLMDMTDENGKSTFLLPYDSSFGIRGEIFRPTTGAISGLDAAWIHQCILGTRTNECYGDITDVTRNGETTLLDVWYTLRKSVGYNDPESHAGEWLVYDNGLSYTNWRQNLDFRFMSIIVGDLTYSGPIGFWDNTTVVASNAPSVEMTGSSRQLVIDVNAMSFNALAFEITSTANISVTGISADGFQTMNNGLKVGLSSPNTVDNTQVVIDITAPVGAHVDIVNLKVDEYQLIEGVVASLDLEEESEQIFHNQIHLPFLEKEILNLGEEEMPILEPDQN